MSKELLEKIKDDIATEWGFDSWEDAQKNDSRCRITSKKAMVEFLLDRDKIYNEISERYAEAVLNNTTQLGVDGIIHNQNTVISKLNTQTEQMQKDIIELRSRLLTIDSGNADQDIEYVFLDNKTITDILNQTKHYEE